MNLRAANIRKNKNHYLPFVDNSFCTRYSSTFLTNHNIFLLPVDGRIFQDEEINA